MKLTTRLAAATAAGLMTLTTFAGAGASTAQAQETGGILSLVNGNVKEMDCGVMRSTLNATRLVGPDTTRQQLVNNLNKQIGDNIALRFVAASTVQTVADRALTCGIVKPDQTLDFNQLSSQMNLPPQVQQLSSQGLSFLPR